MGIAIWLGVTLLGVLKWGPGDESALCCALGLVAGLLYVSAVSQKGVDTMSQETDKPKPRPGPLVEDETVVGGYDEQTGAAVIRPKTPDGRADESTRPTDRREK